MERLVFMVQGSSSEPYRVVLEKNGGGLDGFCTCAAGSKRQVCKHVMRILMGNPEGIVEGDAHLSAANGWLAGSDVERALIKLALAEDNLASAKSLLRKAKEDLSKEGLNNPH